jgi:hypothetical protein
MRKAAVDFRLSVARKLERVRVERFSKALFG